MGAFRRPAIGAGHRPQFEAVRANLPGIFQVGSAAEVHETVLLVDRDSPLFQAINEFQLEVLAGEKLLRFFLAYLLPDKGMAAGDNAPHFFFNGREVLKRYGLWQEKVVIKPIVDGGPMPNRVPG
jgi:hypothetical protein